MQQHDIEQRVIQVIQACWGDLQGPVTASSRLSEDLFLDSLDKVETDMEIEDAFDLGPDEQSFRDVKTVQDYIDRVRDRLAQAKKG